MKNPPWWRVVGLLVIVNITGEREYSYKVPFFAKTVTELAKENPPTGWPGGLLDIASANIGWSGMTLN